MSFLQKIQNQRSNLKGVKMIVTQCDGRRFVKTASGLSPEMELERSFGFIVDTKPDNIPVHIADNIYLGSQDCADISTLTRYGIGRVLSIGVETQASCLSSLAYRFVSCLDLPETALKPVLLDCIRFIQASEEIVLVHCNAGVSRAPAVVIGYLMMVRKLSFWEAYDSVKSRRPCVSPNAGFVKQLKELGNDNSKEAGFALHGGT